MSITMGETKLMSLIFSFELSNKMNGVTPCFFKPISPNNVYPPIEIRSNGLVVGH